ncbi:hypothetical protein V5799_006598, partial [Amblyomma americanum]
MVRFLCGDVKTRCLQQNNIYSMDEKLNITNISLFQQERLKSRCEEQPKIGWD